LEYNQTCNEDPEFSVHRIERLDSDHPRCLVHHRVSGMLGVYGNIVGSTVLHGLSSISIVGAEEHVNTIGDDAGIKIDVNDITLEDTIECIQVIGDVATEKFEIWDDDEIYHELSTGWHYVKRPITVKETYIAQRWMPDFPVLARILGVSDGMHTTRPEDFVTRRRLLIKQTCRLFDAMTRNQQFCSEEDIEVCLSILRRMYILMRLPSRGSFPLSRGSMPNLQTSAIYPDSILCTPQLSQQSVRRGWFTVLRDRVNTETIFVSVPEVVGSQNLPDEFYVGCSFKSTGSRLLGLMEKIGVVSKESRYEDWLLTEDIVDILDQLIKKEIRQVYTYVVLQDYDPWASVQAVI